jgi:transposase
MPPGAKGRRYPEELRERAVRMVFDHQHEYPSQWKAVESVAEKLDVHRETLRVWVRKAEVEHGQRAGMTNAERERLKELEAEVKELRRANEILKAAAGFFARELAPRPPKS